MRLVLLLLALAAFIVGITLPAVFDIALLPESIAIGETSIATALASAVIGLAGTALWLIMGVTNR